MNRIIDIINTVCIVILILGFIFMVAGFVSQLFIPSMGEVMFKAFLLVFLTSCAATIVSFVTALFC